MNFTRPMRDEDWVSSLEAELTLRSGLLDRLEDAVRRQDALIKGRDMGGLCLLLAERQAVVDDIESGAERLACLLDRFEQEVARLALQRVEAIRELVGRISRRLDSVLEADARTADGMEQAMQRIRGLQMVLVGEGSDSARVQAMVAAAGLGPERLRLLGNVSEREMRMLYARARVAVVASRYEGFGLPAVEALAAGVPLLATRTGGIAEVAGDAAALIDPDSPTALAEALYRVAFEMAPEDRSNLAERGRARAQRVTWQSAVRLTAAAYRHVFARERGEG